MLGTDSNLEYSIQWPIALEVLEQLECFVVAGAT